MDIVVQKLQAFLQTTAAPRKAAAPAPIAPRRGRPAGSKNKPKEAAPAAKPKGPSKVDGLVSQYKAIKAQMAKLKVQHTAESKKLKAKFDKEYGGLKAKALKLRQELETKHGVKFRGRKQGSDNKINGFDDRSKRPPKAPAAKPEVKPSSKVVVKPKTKKPAPPPAKTSKLRRRPMM